jgi:hypothetical protein
MGGCNVDEQYEFSVTILIQRQKKKKRIDIKHSIPRLTHAERGIIKKVVDGKERVQNDNIRPDHKRRNRKPAHGRSLSTAQTRILKRCQTDKNSNNALPSSIG